MTAWAFRKRLQFSLEGHLRDAITIAFSGRSAASDEAILSGRNFGAAMASASRHDWLNILGGSIGRDCRRRPVQRFAAPDRKVVALEGDGNGMYTLRALWTDSSNESGHRRFKSWRRSASSLSLTWNPEQDLADTLRSPLTCSGPPAAWTSQIAAPLNSAPRLGVARKAGSLVALEPITLATGVRLGATRDPL